MFEPPVLLQCSDQLSFEATASWSESAAGGSSILFFFLFQSCDVPCWMFIGWISQMVALLDKGEGTAVHGILQAIAENYPQVSLICFALAVLYLNLIFHE